MTARLAIVMFLVAGTALCQAQSEKAEAGQASEVASENGQPKPLTKAQVLDLVAAGMQSSKLAKVVREHGIDFIPTAEDLAALRKSGAADALIKALGRAPQSNVSGPVPVGADDLAASRNSGATVAPIKALGRALQPIPSGPEPLDKDKLLRLVVRGTPNPRTLDLVETVGLNFRPTDEFLDTLRIAGADGAVIAAVRSAVPVTPQPAQPSSPTASGKPEAGTQAGDEGGPIYQAGPDVTAPKRLFTPEPPYTEKARHQGIEGTVVLTIVVDATGNVTDVKVVQALDPGLDDSAARTVRTWKFQPATRGGKPVAVGIRVEVSFGLYHQPR
jgi:TonB family protein